MNCYLCNHPDFRVRQGNVRDAPSLQIRECSNCGLVALSSFQHIQPNHYEESGMHGEDLPSVESWLRETEQDDQRRFEMLKAALVKSPVLVESQLAWRKSALVISRYLGTGGGLCGRTGHYGQMQHDYRLLGKRVRVSGGRKLTMSLEGRE